MSKVISEEAKITILELLSRKEIAILIIEDHKEAQRMLEMVLEEAFPKCTTYCYEGFGVDDDPLEKLIQSNKYDIITVDGLFGKWQSHPLFGKEGVKVVKFIKEHSPKTFIISISLQPENNTDAIKNGAALGVDKGDLGKFLEEVKELH